MNLGWLIFWKSLQYKLHVSTFFVLCMHYTHQYISIKLFLSVSNVHKHYQTLFIKTYVKVHIRGCTLLSTKIMYVHYLKLVIQNKYCTMYVLKVPYVLFCVRRKCSLPSTPLLKTLIEVFIEVQYVNKVFTHVPHKFCKTRY